MTDIMDVLHILHDHNFRFGLIYILIFGISANYISKSFFCGVCCHKGHKGLISMFALILKVDREDHF